MRYPASTALLFIVLCLAGTPASVKAQAPPSPDSPQSDVTLEIVPGARPPMRLAFPRMESSGVVTQAGLEAAGVVEQVLRSDLAESGAFSIQGPEELRVLQLTGDRERDFELYRSLGNEILLLGDLTQDGTKLVLEGRVFDLKSGDTWLAKRYRADLGLARRIAHTLADEVIRYFTGTRGVNLTDIAFYSDRTGAKEIFLMDADGSSPRQITAHRSISLSPDWSPLRDAIAYVSYVSGEAGVYLVDLTSGRKTSVFAAESHTQSPTFSADGTHIAYARSVDGNMEIFVRNRDGSNPRRITHGRSIDVNPAWSPVGDRIAFTSNRTGSQQIYVMDADGTNLQRVSTSGSYNDGAAWSPGGTKIAYATRRGGGFDIVVTDLSTLETRAMTNGRGTNEAPSFSPDGKRLAFASTRTGAWQIHVLDLLTGRQRQLTRSGQNWSPAWSGYLAEGP